MKLARIISLKLTALILFCFFVSTTAFPDEKIVKNGDLRFLQEAANNCAWKVTLGNVARKQAASGDVKRYAEIIVMDHGDYCRELNRFADRKGFSIAEDPDKVRKNTLLFLSREYGAGFDRSYISLMMDDNLKDAQLYGMEADKGRDKDIRTFASRIVKKMEEYARMAEKILRELPQPLLK